ncbi:hypothetical protein [Noviherbaspirillum aerium]|uniref:hypothetical protein n=1 Tax=Noviherbaspirillum aerium TaxID=2588497 RepID=UPI00124DC09B|nr:hypothetical protein [Noviherbaspirillum aerium]
MKQVIFQLQSQSNIRKKQKMTKIHGGSNDPSAQYRADDPNHKTSKPDAPAPKPDPDDIENAPSRGAAPPEPAPKPEPDDVENAPSRGAAPPEPAPKDPDDI